MTAENDSRESLRLRSSWVYATKKTYAFLCPGNANCRGCTGS